MSKQPCHAGALPAETRRGERLLDTPAKIARALVVMASRDITFIHAAIATYIHVEPDGFHVRLDTIERETGEPISVDLRDDLPPVLISYEHAVDWIYARVRHAWVHELNEALFLGGKRRRDLHNDRGQTIQPPDEAP